MNDTTPQNKPIIKHWSSNGRYQCTRNLESISENNQIWFRVPLLQSHHGQLIKLFDEKGDGINCKEFREAMTDEPMVLLGSTEQALLSHKLTNWSHVTFCEAHKVTTQNYLCSFNTGHKDLSLAEQTRFEALAIPALDKYRHNSQTNLNPENLKTSFDQCIILLLPLSARLNEIIEAFAAIACHEKG